MLHLAKISKGVPLMPETEPGTGQVASLCTGKYKAELQKGYRVLKWRTLPSSHNSGSTGLQSEVLKGMQAPS